MIDRPPITDVRAEAPEECCGTCTRWTAHRERGGTYCPIVDQTLDGLDFTKVRCAGWAQELYETDALELYYQILIKKGQQNEAQ